MIAGIYVIEFQKRGLPHAHILIFFAEDCKPHTVEDVDRMISVELPNRDKQVGPRNGYQMHDAWSSGATFANAPCMEWQMQKAISTQVPIRNSDGCKWISYLSTQRYGAHNFGS